MDNREKKEKSEGLNSEPNLMGSENEDVEDLSLKIVEKAKLRACSNVVNEEEAEIVTNLKVVSGGIDKGFKSFCGDMFPQGKACFICKKRGHRANDYPERSHGGSQSTKVCLNCGDSGHDMFSCRNNYFADDLKEIQCYICKSFGHLCCAKYPDSCPRKFSCYICGLLGHTGLACTASRGDTSGTGSLKPCYKCGEEGDFARECTNLSRGKKRNHELSTPKKKVPKKRKEQKEFRSVPRDFGRAWKKGKNEGGYTTGYKVKRRGGWIPDDPEGYPQSNNWRSPSTPRNKRAKISNFSTGGHAFASRSSRKSNKLDFDSSASYGSGKYHHNRFSASGVFDNSASYGSGKYHHHHRFSASQFGNSSHDMWRRNNDWSVCHV